MARGSCNAFYITAMNPIAEDDPEVLYALSIEPNLDVETFRGVLIGKEPFWAHNQPLLLSRGYRLRPRYQPDWVPSWRGFKGPLKGLIKHEDAWCAQVLLYCCLALFKTLTSLQTPNLLDAVRTADGKQVVIKCVETASEEIPIATYMSSVRLQSDPRNHAVPILDVILLPDDDSQALIVMPLLLHLCDIPFRRVGDLAEAINQYLQVSILFAH